MRGNEVESILWHRLIDLYRQDRRFQATIGQDLHPLWKQAGSPGVGEFPFGHEFNLLAADSDGHPDPSRAYISKVAQTVRSMRLFDRPFPPAPENQRRELRPASRAALQVHVSVTYWPQAVGANSTLLITVREQATLELKIAGQDGDFIMSATGATAGKPDETAFCGSIDEIEKSVHEAVSAWIAAIRSRNRQRYPNVNTGTVEQRLHEVEALFAYLWHNRWSGDATQYKQFQRLAKLMDLTLPLRSKT